MDRDITKAWIANVSVLGTVTMADAELGLKVLLLALTCLYTAIKCWKALKSKSDDTEIIEKGK